MAETTTDTSQRMGRGQPGEDVYGPTVKMLFEPDQAWPTTRGVTIEEPSARTAETDAQPASHRPTSDATTSRRSAAHDRAEINRMAETSVQRIELLRSENVELRAETQRLRQDLHRLRERNAALERANSELDGKIGELGEASAQVAELRRTVEYLRSAKQSLRRELHQTQTALADADRRTAHTESQLRGICQQRADRVTVLTEDVGFLQRAKADLEEQVETLLRYRQRAMACMRQLTEELKQVRKESREKSRRLSESQAILKSIDQRLAESIDEPTSMDA